MAEEDIPPDLFVRASLELNSYERGGKSNGTQDALVNIGNYLGRIADGETPQNADRWVRGSQKFYGARPTGTDAVRSQARTLCNICTNPLEHKEELNAAANFLRYLGTNS